MVCLVLRVLVVMSSQPTFKELPLAHRNCSLPSRNKDILKDVPLPLVTRLLKYSPRNCNFTYRKKKKVSHWEKRKADTCSQPEWELVSRRAHSSDSLSDHHTEHKEAEPMRMGVSHPDLLGYASCLLLEPLSGPEDGYRVGKHWTSLFLFSTGPQ